VAFSDVHVPAFHVFAVHVPAFHVPPFLLQLLDDV
jgi:hypothetical protein